MVLRFRIRRVEKRKDDVVLRWHQSSEGSKAYGTHGLRPCVSQSGLAAVSCHLMGL